MLQVEIGTSLPEPAAGFVTGVLLSRPRAAQLFTRHLVLSGHDPGGERPLCAWHYGAEIQGHLAEEPMRPTLSR